MNSKGFRWNPLESLGLVRIVFGYLIDGQLTAETINLVEKSDETDSLLSW